MIPPPAPGQHLTGLPSTLAGSGDSRTVSKPGKIKGGKGNSAQVATSPGTFQDCLRDTDSHPANPRGESMEAKGQGKAPSVATITAPAGNTPATFPSQGTDSTETLPLVRTLQDLVRTGDFTQPVSERSNPLASSNVRTVLSSPLQSLEPMPSLSATIPGLPPLTETSDAPLQAGQVPSAEPTARTGQDVKIPVKTPPNNLSVEPQKQEATSSTQNHLHSLETPASPANPQISVSEFPESNAALETQTLQPTVATAPASQSALAASHASLPQPEIVTSTTPSSPREVPHSVDALSGNHLSAPSPQSIGSSESVSRSGSTEINPTGLPQQSPPKTAQAPQPLHPSPQTSTESVPTIATEPSLQRLVEPAPEQQPAPKPKAVPAGKFTPAAPSAAQANPQPAVQPASATRPAGILPAASSPAAPVVSESAPATPSAAQTIPQPAAQPVNAARPESMLPAASAPAAPVVVESAPVTPSAAQTNAQPAAQPASAARPESVLPAASAPAAPLVGESAPAAPLAAQTNAQPAAQPEIGRAHV